MTSSAPTRPDPREQERLLRDGHAIYRRGIEALRGGDLDEIAAFRAERRRYADLLRPYGPDGWLTDDPGVAEAASGLLVLEEQLDQLVEETMEATRAELLSLRAGSRGLRRYGDGR